MIRVGNIIINAVLSVFAVVVVFLLGCQLLFFLTPYLPAENDDASPVLTLLLWIFGGFIGLLASALVTYLLWLVLSARKQRAAYEAETKIIR